MKIFNLKLLITLVAAFVLITNCSKDSSKTASPYIGKYTFSESKTALPMDIPVKTPLVDSIVFTAPAGTDITGAISAALLGAIQCSTSVKVYIEIRADNSVYYSCEGNSPMNAGTWNEVSATELILNLNSTAVPTSPTGIQLTITDILIDANGLTGVTTVPLPKELIALSLPQGVTLLTSAPNFFVEKFSIKFAKVAQ